MQGEILERKAQARVNRKGGGKAKKIDDVKGSKIGDELEIAKFDKGTNQR